MCFFASHAHFAISVAVLSHTEDNVRKPGRKNCSGRNESLPSCEAAVCYSHAAATLDLYDYNYDYVQPSPLKKRKFHVAVFSDDVAADVAWVVDGDESGDNV